MKSNFFKSLPIGLSEIDGDSFVIPARVCLKEPLLLWRVCLIESLMLSKIRFDAVRLLQQIVNDTRNVLTLINRIKSSCFQKDPVKYGNLNPFPDAE